MSTPMKVDMSCFDSMNAAINLLYVYFFDDLLDEKKLEMSLERTIDAIPLLNSVFRQSLQNVNSKMPQLHLEVVEKDMKKIFFKKVLEEEDEEIFDLYKPDEKWRLYDLKEGIKLHGFCESIETERPFKLDVGLLKVTYMVLPNKKKSVIGVSINHGLVDLYSYGQFLDTWVSIYNDNLEDLPKIVFERPIRTSDDFHKRVSRKEQLIKMGVFHPTNKFSLMAAFGQVLVQKELHFSPERIEELKRLAGWPEFRCSTHDVICAHLWKLFAVCREVSSTTTFPFLYHYTFRGDLYPGITSEYFGNAAHTACMEMTRKVVIKSTFKELVMKIRGLVNSIERSDIQVVIDDFERNPLPHPKMKYDWLYGTNVNDWRLLGSKLPRFGGVKCLRYAAPPVQYFLPNFFFLETPVNEEQKGGVNVLCPFPINMHKKVRNFDLTSSKVYQQIMSQFQNFVEIQEGVLEKYDLVKTSELMYIIIGIDEIDKNMYVTGSGGVEHSLEDIIQQLPDKEGRYVYINFKYDHQEGKREKIVFMKWIPDAAGVRTRFLYSSHFGMLKRDCTWNVLIDFHEKEDISQEAIKEKCMRFFN